MEDRKTSTKTHIHSESASPKLVMTDQETFLTIGMVVGKDVLFVLMAKSQKFHM